MHVPLCHALYDPDCRGDRYIPFLRNRYDFRTGYSPNNPRMQLNEITPWLDGGLMYGVTKTWADTLRNLRNGRLASLDETDDFPMIAGSLPIENTVGLPMANPPPPANNSLFPVNRFWSKSISLYSFVYLDVRYHSSVYLCLPTILHKNSLTFLCLYTEQNRNKCDGFARTQHFPFWQYSNRYNATTIVENRMILDTVQVQVLTLN